jgi:hypothetical protein
MACLLGMLRTRADVVKAKLLEGTANRHLVEIDIEASLMTGLRSTHH